MNSFIDTLNDCGVRARPTTYLDKDDERWISLIQDVLLLPQDGLERPKLQVFEGNPGIVTDIQQVQWQKIRNEDAIYRPKLDITKKDFLAALKYALASNLSFQKKRARIHGPRPEEVNWRGEYGY